MSKTCIITRVIIITHTCVIFVVTRGSIVTGNTFVSVLTVVVTPVRSPISLTPCARGIKVFPLISSVVIYSNIVNVFVLKTGCWNLNEFIIL